MAARSRELLNGIVDGASVDLGAEVLRRSPARHPAATASVDVAKELAFAAHHATHHFRRGPRRVPTSAWLPDDVDRAPATLRHDRQASSTGAYVDVGG